MKEFKGRIVAPGCVSASALVSHGGLNTLASFQKALQFGDKKATCGDQNNPDLYGKQMAGKALCLPRTIGSTTGGLVLYCACSMKRQPACMLFSEPIDSLAAAGAVLADVWLDDVSMPVVDSLGEDFLNYVKENNECIFDSDIEDAMFNPKKKPYLDQMVLLIDDNQNDWIIQDDGYGCINLFDKKNLLDYALGKDIPLNLLKQCKELDSEYM